MSLNNSQYDTLVRQYNARQFHNQHLLDERIQKSTENVRALQK